MNCDRCERRNWVEDCGVYIRRKGKKTSMVRCGFLVFSIFKSKTKEEGQFGYIELLTNKRLCTRT